MIKSFFSKIKRHLVSKKNSIVKTAKSAIKQTKRIYHNDPIGKFKDMTKSLKDIDYKKQFFK